MKSLTQTFNFKRFEEITADDEIRIGNCSLKDTDILKFKDCKLVNRLKIFANMSSCTSFIRHIALCLMLIISDEI
jgi:hypothetical protein